MFEIVLQSKFADVSRPDAEEMVEMSILRVLLALIQSEVGPFIKPSLVLEMVQVGFQLIPQTRKTGKQIDSCDQLFIHNWFQNQLYLNIILLIQSSWYSMTIPFLHKLSRNFSMCALIRWLFASLILINIWNSWSSIVDQWIKSWWDHVVIPSTFYPLIHNWKFIFLRNLSRRSWRNSQANYIDHLHFFSCHIHSFSKTRDGGSSQLSPTTDLSYPRDSQIPVQSSSQQHEWNN